MKRFFWIAMRFNACIALYCAEVSGNSSAKAEAVMRIAEADRELLKLEKEQTK